MDIEFENDNEIKVMSRRVIGEPVMPRMVKFLLKTGLVKNYQQAAYMLIGLIVVPLLLAGLIFWYWVIGGSSPHYPRPQIIPAPGAPTIKL